MNMNLFYLVFLLFFFVVLGDKTKSKINANKSDKNALEDFLISLTGNEKGYDKSNIGHNNDKFSGYGEEHENVHEHGEYGHGYGRPNQDYGHGFGGSNHEDGEYGHSLSHSGYNFRPYDYGSFKPNQMYQPGYPPNGPPLIGFLVFFPDMNGYHRKRS